MIIKPLADGATEQQIVDLGRRMFAESNFSSLGFDEGRAVAYAQRMIHDPAFISLGVFSDDEPVGMAVGPCGDTLPFSRAIVAYEHLLFIDDAHRGPYTACKLIREFIAEALRRGAKRVTFTNGTGFEPERVGKLFEICGLSKVGGLYVWEA